MKTKIGPDFHLSCNCFLQVSKGARAQGMDIPGLLMTKDKAGNTGLGLVIVKRLINPDGSRQTGMIALNFCPFCGKQIAVQPVGFGGDKNGHKE